ncbi:hypothetical protein N0V88_002971 [Collariella sp. IMI 366227]|nr:hypothetical protein N0V88_002971 [Collariella sp. IMI 366227]
MRTTHAVAVALSAGLRLASAAPCSSASSTLYVSSFPPAAAEGAPAKPGSVTTFTLGQGGLKFARNTTECGTHPTWLTQAGNTLYCLDEAWPVPKGGLHSFKIGADSGVSHLGKIETLGGPVSSVVYGEGGRGLAVADYAGKGLNTFNIADPAKMVALKAPTFDPNPVAGTNPDQQGQSRPHQVILDPTGDFLLAPDLGNDVVRVFAIDKKTLDITEKKSLELERKSGPRHAVFLKSKTKTFLYVVCEVSNLVLGYSVEYKGQELSFTPVHSSNTHGDNKPLPTDTAAGEIAISPDSNFLTISSRRERSLQFTLANGTTVPSDPLVTLSVNHDTGVLTHVQTAPAGGIFPRHFSFNKDGSRVAVAAQDVKTGKIGKAVAEAEVGGPNCVVFKE